MYDIIKLLPTSGQKHTGRRHCRKQAMVTGILQLRLLFLILPRYFREIQRRGILKKQFKQPADKRTDVAESAIETDSAAIFRFRRGAGRDDRHKKIAAKISLLPVDQKHHRQAQKDT